MEKQTSFIKKTIALLIAQVLVLLVLLNVVVWVVLRAAESTTGAMVTNYMNLYTGAVEDVLQDGDKILGRIVYDNSDLRLLQASSEENRFYASVRTLNLLQNEIATDNNFDALVVAASAYDTCLESYDGSVTHEFKEAIRSHMLDAAADGHSSMWSITSLAGEDYVYRMYAWQGWSAGIFISLDKLMGTDAGEHIRDLDVVVTDENGTICGVNGDLVAAEVGSKISDISTSGYNVELRDTIDGLQIYSVATRQGLIYQIRYGYVVLFLMALLTVIMATLIIRYIRRAVLLPMESIQDHMRRMQAGDLDIRIADAYETLEFTMLKNTFNDLMDEVMELKIATYEKQISLSEMELRAIRLQIRPHFFLNALTTISGLSMQQKNAEIQKYIDALSKNVRYMFKAGLHTVSLAEEIRHVKNYFEMQELKYPGCVFYYTQIAEDLMEWKIPQLMIHTIIENEYKYAVEIGKTLTILISAREEERNGKKYLHLEIEDDGGGYPDSVLSDFANPKGAASADGTRVGLWSIRRMLTLMYEEEGLFIIENVQPHGCLNVFEIPAETVNELAESKKEELVL